MEDSTPRSEAGTCWLLLYGCQAGHHHPASSESGGIAGGYEQASPDATADLKPTTSNMARLSEMGASTARTSGSMEDDGVDSEGEARASLSLNCRLR